MQVVIVEVNLAADTLPDHNKILGYLSGGAILTMAAGMTDDELDPTKKFVVPIGLKTDGKYCWPIALEYYMENHWIGVTGPFLTEIRESGYLPPELTPERLLEIRALLAQQATTAAHPQ